MISSVSTPYIDLDNLELECIVRSMMQMARVYVEVEFRNQKPETDRRRSTASVCRQQPNAPSSDASLTQSMQHSEKSYL